MSWSDDMPAYMQRCIAEAPAHDEKAVLELIARARTGNAKAMDALVRQFMEYALSVASTMEYDFSYRVSAEDFLQAALEGLLETIRRRYDPERGAKFTTVAWMWMRKYCFELAAELGYPVKKPRHRPVGSVPLDAPVRPDGHSVADVSAAEGIGPEASVIIAASWRSVLLTLVRAINGLDDTSRASVIRRHLFGSGLLPALNAPAIKLHRITLWKKERHALHRLREALSGELTGHAVIGTLRFIDTSRGIDGFDDSLELAFAA